jgi:formamidopyrimidine-DNA glycosylase
VQNRASPVQTSEAKLNQIAVCAMTKAAMPELPEVEFARRQVERWTRLSPLLELDVEKKCRLFRDCRPADLLRVKGALVFAKRKGKQLWFQFQEGPSLMIHLGMTGKFLKRRDNETPPKFSKCRFALESGEVIHFCDMRMFGKVDVFESSVAQKAFDALGIDLLTESLSPTIIRDALGSSKQDLKVALLDQNRLAGLGNIHAAEALFRAKLSPFAKASQLTSTQWKRLTKGISEAIAFALEQNGTGEELVYVEEGGANPFLIYGRAGTPCIRCKNEVQSSIQAQRTTHFCPTCQGVKQ